MDSARKTQLQELGQKVFDTDGQDDLDEFLDDEDERRAVEFLLGAVDRVFSDESIDSEQAAEYYRILNVSPERASELRQDHQTQ